jgi:hypothetical protein
VFKLAVEVTLMFNTGPMFGEAIDKLGDPLYRSSLAFGPCMAISCARSYRTLRDGLVGVALSRHFVPGYDRLSLRDALANISQTASS